MCQSVVLGLGLWIVGLLIALLLGKLTGLILKRIRKSLACGDPQMCDYYNDNPVAAPRKGWYMGSTFGKDSNALWERAFFVIVVAFDVGGAAVAMVAWTAAKGFLSHPKGNRQPAVIELNRCTTGILGSLISMLFALIGGLICRAGNIVLSNECPLSSIIGLLGL
ncbi:MAG: hypothetical protein KOO62_06055 [candidate division Zixibacteria bacterium]|nr:hypothetical protein [candidate division Zixibacteria bacterium]